MGVAGDGDDQFGNITKVVDTKGEVNIRGKKRVDGGISYRALV